MRSRVFGVGGNGSRTQSVAVHTLGVAHVERIDDGRHFYELALGNVFVRTERAVRIGRKDADVGTLLGVSVPIRVNVLEGAFPLEIRRIRRVVPESRLTEEHGRGLNAAGAVFRAERNAVPRFSVLARVRSRPRNGIPENDFPFLRVGNAVEIRTLLFEIEKRDFTVLENVGYRGSETLAATDSDGDGYELVAVHEGIRVEFPVGRSIYDSPVVKLLEIATDGIGNRNVGKWEIGGESL